MTDDITKAIERLQAQRMSKGLGAVTAMHVVNLNDYRAEVVAYMKRGICCYSYPEYGYHADDCALAALARAINGDKT